MTKTPSTANAATPLGDLSPNAISKLTLKEWNEKVTCPKDSVLGETRPGINGCTRQDGTMHGYMSFWVNGQIAWHRHYHDDKAHGRAFAWHADGTPLRRERYVHGKQEGPSNGWHKNGQSYFEYNFVGGLRHGLALRFASNGTMISQGKLEHGKHIGVHESWYDSGKIKHVLRHIEGEEYETESWREDGTREEKGRNIGWMKAGEWLYFDTQDRLQLREEYDGNLNLFRRSSYENGKLVKKQKLVPPMPQVRMY